MPIFIPFHEDWQMAENTASVCIYDWNAHVDGFEFREGEISPLSHGWITETYESEKLIFSVKFSCEPVAVMEEETEMDDLFFGRDGLGLV